MMHDKNYKFCEYLKILEFGLNAILSQAKWRAEVVSTVKISFLLFFVIIRILINFRRKVGFELHKFGCSYNFEIY